MTNHKILHLADLCTGCFACYNTCPKDAISMDENKEGFYFPVIDPALCINCGLCDKVCPRISPQEYHTTRFAYYGWSSNDKDRRNSSSGGIFSAMASSILEQSGTVYGATFNYQVPIRLECRSSREVSLSELQKSKYVQSYVGNAFRAVKQDLHTGCQVLFCGTPCQVDGLRNFLKQDYENLITVDFVCHGVPSMSLLRLHLDFLGLKKVSEINFRPKRKSWVDDFIIKHASGIRCVPWEMDEYFYTFQKYKSIRSSCMSCRHSNGQRAADITIADFWGINQYNPALYDPRGVSLVLANTVNGNNFIQQCIHNKSSELHPLEPCYAEYIYAKDRTLEKSSYDKTSRNAFIQDVYALGYKPALKRHGYYISRTTKLKKAAKDHLRAIKRLFFK